MIFTTEDKSMMDEQRTWLAENGQAHSLFEFEFVLNGRDMLPGSGFIRDVGKCKKCLFLLSCEHLQMIRLWPSLTNYIKLHHPFPVWQNRGMGMAADPDANMLSSMSSLKAQLLPRLSIGNCCSNFHTLLSDFLVEGCGAASENTFHV